VGSKLTLRPYLWLPRNASEADLSAFELRDLFLAKKTVKGCSPGRRSATFQRVGLNARALCLHRALEAVEDNQGAAAGLFAESKANLPRVPSVDLVLGAAALRAPAVSEHIDLKRPGGSGILPLAAQTNLARREQVPALGRARQEHRYRECGHQRDRGTV